MDGRRLIAALALAAGCRGARADVGSDAAPRPTGGDEPRHGIDVPAAWKELPGIAEAAVAAGRGVLGDGAVHAHAWGETSRGCYLAILSLDGVRRDTIAGVLRALQTALEPLKVQEWSTSPDAEDRSEIQARFATPTMAGRLRAHLVLDGQRIPHALAAACFYNDRQPIACDDACVPLLTMLAPLELPPAP